MKFTGSHFGLVFLTSSDLEPEDFLNETDFTCKMSAIFAPWDEIRSATEIPSREEFEKLCKTEEMCNMVVKNLEGI